MSHAWVELDTAILRDNIRRVQAVLSPRTDLIFVVKSNAYGHGILQVAKVAWDCGVRWFAVAHVDEGNALRTALPDADLLVVGAIDATDVPLALQARLIVVLAGPSHAARLANAAVTAGGVLQCHLKVETGMGRLGFTWDGVDAVLPGLARLKGLNICGACSHFASSDADDRAVADMQAERFRDFVRKCEASGLSVPYRHISNSGALMREQAWDMNGVRPGIMMYGYGPNLVPGRMQTLPFLQWKTRIVQIRDVPSGFPVSYDGTYVTAGPARLAAISVGYGDGYFRALSNRGFVLAGGQRCPVRGRVTMNLTVVELGPGNRAAEGDEVVLVGKQGRESLWADEVAGWAGTIPYEIVTAIRTNDYRLL